MLAALLHGRYQLSPLLWKLKGTFKTQRLVDCRQYDCVHKLCARYGLTETWLVLAVMALYTTLEGCLVRVDAYGNINWKSLLGLFSCFTAP